MVKITEEQWSVLIGVIIIIIFLLCIYVYNKNVETPYYPDNPKAQPIIAIASNDMLMPYIDNLSSIFYQKYAIKVTVNAKGNDTMVVKALDIGISDIGVISRNLTSNETASGLNQTLISFNNTVNMPIVFITKDEPTENVKTFINFTINYEGQSVLAKDSLIPLNNSSITE